MEIEMRNFIFCKALLPALVAVVVAPGCMMSSESSDDHVGVATEAVTVSDTLLSGQGLSNGAYIQSANGQYIATMQAADSHLVVYDINNGYKVMWAAPVA